MQILDTLKSRIHKALGIVVPFMLLTIVPACSPQAQTFDERLDQLYSRTVPLIKADELREKMAKQDTVYLLDTRTKGEYKVSHLKGSTRIGYDPFHKEKIQDIPKDATVVTYCTVGYRSEKIGERLEAMGYDHVYNLYGSMISWVNAGYPVYDPEGNTTQKVHTHSEEWEEYLKNGEAVYE